MGMSMRIDIQRKIFKRDITVRCIHAILLQRQRVGIAAGNGQVLTMELKARIPLNVLQQVDLITIRRGSDCIVQSGVVVRIVDLVDLAHRRGCGAAGVVRRGIALQFLVKSFGGEIHCGPVIRCCFIAVRVRRVIATRFLVKSFWGGIPCGQVIRCFIAVRIRKVIVTRSLVKSFFWGGGGIPCGPVIRCFFIVVRIHDSELLFR